MSPGRPPGTDASSITESLVALLGRPISDADRADAALRIVDWLGCAAAGWNTPAGQVLSGVSPFDRAGRNPADWALALGGLGSILEMDDVHREALLHPGPVVVPAALCAGDAAAGTVVLDAVVIGYEAMIRLGRSVGSAHYAMFHNTATCGALGAAAAAARILDLAPAQVVHAFGNAMSLSGGLWQCRNEPVMTKPLHVAEATGRGVRAALFASAGLSGPRLILEGPQGFFAAMAPDGHPDRLTASAPSWLIHETSFKPWPACRHAHPTIDAALQLREQLAGQTVQSVTISTYADAVLFCDRPDPANPTDAKFSLQHAVATVLARGKPTLADFEPQALRASELTDLRARCQVQVDDRYTRAYPAHFGASVSVTAADGNVPEAHVTDAWGDAENPMQQADIVEKYRKLMAWARVAPAVYEPLLDATLNLARGGRVEKFRQCLMALQPALAQSVQ